MKIALVGNKNSGKTTIFQALTGVCPYVAHLDDTNKIKVQEFLLNRKDVEIELLRGVESLTCFVQHEKDVRKALIEDGIDVIINMIDGIDLESSLYLTLQLLELNIPMVIGINRMDALKQRGEEIDSTQLKKRLGIDLMGVAAVQNTGVPELLERAMCLGESKPKERFYCGFSQELLDDLAKIEEQIPFGCKHKKWCAVKIFERDLEVAQRCGFSLQTIAKLEEVIVNREEQREEDSCDIISGERYEYIASILSICVKPKKKKFKT